MVKFQLRTSLALIALGFVLGFLTSSLFRECSKPSASKKEVAIVKQQELSKQADNLEKNYQDEIAKLQGENLELQQELEVTDGLLQRAKQTSSTQEKKIKSSSFFDEAFPSRDLLFKFEPIEPVKQIVTSPCDSLVVEVAQYIESNHRKDSLYEQQLVQLDSVVSVKDDLINANEKAYGNLNLLFGESLTAQQNLTTENLLLKKQITKQKVKGKLFTLGGIVLSGLAANFLLHR